MSTREQREAELDAAREEGARLRKMADEIQVAVEALIRERHTFAGALSEIVHLDDGPQFGTLELAGAFGVAQAIALRALDGDERYAEAVHALKRVTELCDNADRRNVLFETRFVRMAIAGEPLPFPLDQPVAALATPYDQDDAEVTVGFVDPKDVQFVERHARPEYGDVAVDEPAPSKDAFFAALPSYNAMRGPIEYCREGDEGA